MKMKERKFWKREREHQCREVKCQHGCEYGKEFQKRNIQRIYVMPYVRGYERIHELNRFAVYRYGWDNEKQNSTTIRIGKMEIKRWVRLEEPLQI